MGPICAQVCSQACLPAGGAPRYLQFDAAGNRVATTAGEAGPQLAAAPPAPVVAPLPAPGGVLLL